MDQFENKDSQNISWWIGSLAASVIICTIFAGYLFNFKEDLDNSKIRSAAMEQRMDVLTNEIAALQHRMTVQQIQVVPPSDAPVQVPTSATPAAGEQPAAASPPTALPNAPEITPPVPAPAPAPAAAPAPAQPPEPVKK